MRHTAGVAALAAALALAPACSQPSGQEPGRHNGEPRISLTTAAAGRLAIDVEGLPAGDLARLEQDPPAREQWQTLLRVQVAPAAAASGDLPPVLGDYAVRDGALRFSPRFPLDPGQRYDVVFDPSLLASAGEHSASSPLRPITATIDVPAPDRAPSTRVAAVYPSALVVPENHLRLYIVFSAPMGLGAAGPYIRVVDEDGNPLADPFLPLDVDLWNADRTRFTVLYDPGRVKRGILPNAEMGRPLAVGATYALEIDAAWRDAEGQPLVVPFRREFRVGPPQEHALDPADWRLDVPAGGTRDPLAVEFPAALDFGLLHRALQVAGSDGRALAGEIRVAGEETRWLFTPYAPWRAGEHHLVAAPTLEDVAGNRIGRPFEVDASSAADARRASGARVPFVITD